MSSLCHKSAWLSIVLIVAALGLSSQARAAKPEIYTGFGSSLAVGGYDTVAYFTEGAPVKGSKDHTYEFRGATWRFSSAQNLAAFIEDPDVFAPRYGGYCAWAMATGKFAKGDPKIWRIVGGALYLNVNKSIQRKWEADIPGFIEKADAIWPGILE